VRKWRQFERLVASIEETLLPEGAIVKHPDRIPDIHTGVLREVDASIQYKVGSVAVLITIECRERAKKDDVLWIEQLAEKQRSIGAVRTIAVSASGFTDPARHKAKILRIELRTIKRIKPKDIRSWVRNLTLSLSSHRLKVKRATLAVFLREGDDQSKLVYETPSGKPALFHEGAFYAPDGENLISMLDLFREEVPKHFRRIEEEGRYETPIHIVLERQFDSAIAAAKTSLGPRWISQIAVECEFRINSRKADIEGVDVYSNPDVDIAQRANFLTELDGERVNIEITFAKKPERTA